VLRGNHPAKIDDKGRLKIPNAFRALIEKQHGTELFVTSLTGEYVRLYPMPVWLAHEEKLSRIATTHPARRKYLDRVNYYGQTAQIDVQGRVVIHPRLRELAGMSGEVAVFGQIDTLDVWNHERFVARMQRDAFDDADAQSLADLGI
jgi:MraZ protein